MRIYFIALCMFMLLPLNAFSQTVSRDVIYLKNGSIIRGVILEIVPGQTIKIQTADSSVFIYPLADIIKTEKVTIQAPTPAVIADTNKNADKGVVKKMFSIYGGVAVPAGDFAKESNGGAQTGFSIGAQYAWYPDEIGWLVDASYTKNACKISSAAGADIGNWQSFLILIGLKVGTTNQSKMNVYFSPQLGILFGTSPEISYNDGSTSIKMSSGSCTSFAYGAAVEFNFNNRILLGAKYIASYAKYNITISAQSTMYGYSYSYSETGDLKQNISIILIYLGVGF
jgi:hypothetical protein